MRELLLHARFNEADICERCGAGDIYEAERSATTRKGKDVPSDALDALIRIFVDGYYLEQAQLLHFFSYEDLGLLHKLGLLLQEPRRNNLCYSPVTLVPVSDCYVVSDRSWDPDGVALELATDAVYPAAVPNTRRFLRLMPHRTCESFLDLCSGTGIAALIAARDFAATAYAVDIAERSVHFAEFNSMLNALSNVINLAGNLYEPVRGRMFDCIVAHPPYVPVLRPKWIYHDGGQDGEEIVRAIIKGLPDFLKPGGTMFMQAMGTDREEGPFEQRIRGWLGEDESDFDVAVVTRSTLDPAEFAIRSLLRGSAEASELGEWKQLFSELRVRDLVLGVMVIHRKDTDRPVFTVRRQFGKATGRPELEWLLRWETAALDGSGARRVLESPLLASTNSELRILSRLENGDWQAGNYTLQTDYPFSMECGTEPWIAHLISKCDGRKTGLEHFRDMIDAGVVYAETPPEEFAEALMVLVSGGFVKLGGA